MNTAEITYDEALRELTKIVEARGRDFCYVNKNHISFGNCFYVPTTDPRIEGKNRLRSASPQAATTGCGVGEFLSATDRMTDDIACSKVNVRALVERGFVSATSKANTFLGMFQRHQDRGATWGESLDVATEYVSNWSESSMTYA